MHPPSGPLKWRWCQNGTESIMEMIGNGLDHLGNGASPLDHTSYVLQLKALRQMLEQAITKSGCSGLQKR